VSTGAEVLRLVDVRLQEGESLENALRRFKRKVQMEDIIKEVKRHSFYLTPGEKKRVNRQHHCSARRFTSVQHWQVPASPAAFA
jgi:small subunit ribosomal protein S21